jgi:hypothetical protein
MKEWTWKIIGFLSIATLIMTLFYVIYKQQEIIKTQDQIYQSITEQKQITDKIVRSQSQYLLAKDFDSKLKELDVDLKDIKRDLKSIPEKTKYEITGILSVNTKTPGSSVKDKPSDSSIPRPDPVDNSTCATCDPYNYRNATQVLKLNEPFANGTQVPFGKTEFSAWKQNPWAYNIYPREYNLTAILAENEDGKKVFYNKLTIKVEGKEYNVGVSSSQFYQKYPQSKFRFNPSLFLGVNSGPYITQPSLLLSPELSLSLFSYGQTKYKYDWSLLSFGIGYDAINKTPLVLVTPVKYNIGNHIPFVRNTFLGIGYSTEFTNHALFMSLSVGL